MRVDPELKLGSRDFDVSSTTRWQLALYVVPSFFPSAGVQITCRGDGTLPGTRRIGLGPSRSEHFLANPDVMHSDFGWFEYRSKKIGAFENEMPMAAADVGNVMAATEWSTWLRSLPPDGGGVLDGAAWIWRLTGEPGGEVVRQTRTSTDDERAWMEGWLKRIVHDDELASSVCDRWS